MLMGYECESRVCEARELDEAGMIYDRCKQTMHTSMVINEHNFMKTV